MTGYPQFRFPWEPLHDTLRRILETRPTVDGQGHLAGYNRLRAADLLRINPGTIYQWEKRGLTVRSADRAAVALGMHPSYIWPDWFEAAA